MNVYSSVVLTRVLIRSSFVIGALLIFASVALAEYGMRAVNVSDQALDDEPVKLKMSKLPGEWQRRDLLVSDQTGKTLPSQVDDLDGDGTPDELVFLVDLPPNSARRVSLRQGTPSTQPHKKLKVRKQDDNHILENGAIRVTLPSMQIVDLEENKKLLQKHPHWINQPNISAGPLRLVLQTREERNGLVNIKRIQLYPDERMVHISHTWTNTSGSSITLSGGSNLGFKTVAKLGTLFGGGEQGKASKVYHPMKGNYMPANIGKELYRHPESGWSAGLVQHTVNGFLRFPDYPRSHYKVKMRKFRLFGNYNYKKHPSSGEGMFPYTLDPGETFTMPMTWWFRKGPEKRTVANFRSDLKSLLGVVSLHGPDGNALKVARGNAHLQEEFEHAGRWEITDGAKLRIKNGRAYISSSGEDEGIYTYLTRDFRDPTELRGKINALPDGGKLNIELKNLITGNTYRYRKGKGTFSELISKNLPDQIEKKQLKAPYKLTLIPSGQNGSNPVRAEVERIGLTWPKPEHPEVGSPFPGQELTNVSTVFSFYSRAYQSAELGYELQVARNKSFDPVLKTYRRKNRIIWFGHASPKEKIVPDEVFPEGTYYWRVRSRSISNEPGEWSDTSKFSVVDDDPGKKNPEREVSARHPLFLFAGRMRRRRDKLIRPLYEDLPEDVRNHSAFEVHVSAWRDREQIDRWMADDSFDILMAYFKSANLSQAEYMFQNYNDRVQGFYFAEKGFRKGGRSMKRGLKLAAKYGNYAGTLGGWSHMKASRILGKTQIEYGKNFLMINKSNNVKEPLARYITGASWRASGRIDFWGSETEWGNAFKTYGLGWGRDAKQTIKKKGGTKPVDWMQPFVYSLSLGCPAYRVERGMLTGHALQGWKDGEFRPFWTHGLGPFYKDILRYDLIPTREEIRDASNVGFRSRPVYGKYWTSSQVSQFPSRRIGAAFGLAEEGVKRRNIFRTEWVPNESRYFFTPILPFHATPEESSFLSSVVSAEEFDGPEKVREHLNQYYPPEESEAYAVRAGDTGVIMNTNDMMKEKMSRRARPESYVLSFTKGPVRKISGTVSYREYIIAKQSPDQLFLHTNDYQDRNTELTLQLKSDAQVRVKPAKAVKQKTKESGGNRVGLKLGHRTGVVRVFVE